MSSKGSYVVQIFKTFSKESPWKPHFNTTHLKLGWTESGLNKCPLQPSEYKTSDSSVGLVLATALVWVALFSLCHLTGRLLALMKTDKKEGRGSVASGDEA